MLFPLKNNSKSVILPVHDAEPWLDECLRSVWQQDFEGSMELSVFNDASKDKSMTIIEKWKVKLEDSGILVVIGGHSSPAPRGVGYSKNQAVAQSSGPYLCFLDSDDVMMPQRVRLQYEAAVRHPTSIIGCQVRREPPSSTGRYTRWINQLAADQLLTQCISSHMMLHDGSPQNRHLARWALPLTRPWLPCRWQTPDSASRASCSQKLPTAGPWQCALQGRAQGGVEGQGEQPPHTHQDMDQRPGKAPLPSQGVRIADSRDPAVQGSTVFSTLNFENKSCRME
ncbi:UDP-GlcNAc:betaGal beta-1,3-N-acetylglucosaminyltransferase-like protein 1 isoform X5 [Pteropus alecto]|uniref:UDP-GlcNAc:betaGal beta-1,3-N-acetylglucosaminyltransferase-like protein 1 isoform X5 n=1 Tax=Pteropus alecto TaxID=9402 RepID=UPI0007687A6E|nr:UDP-GlcNAc:betaGal beta-1,3-N-acetylglucosaminyltransferase-like protein 1 isoform X5 [Pteropus alecto]